MYIHAVHPKPTRHTNQPNTRTQPGPGGPWLPLPSSVPSDTQPPSSPEGLTPGRCFMEYPTPGTLPAFDQSPESCRWFIRHNLTACVPNIFPSPPFFLLFLSIFPKVVAGARRPTVSVNPRLPPVPQSSPGPSHPPLHTPKPHTRGQFPFCSRAPLGARSCR